MDQPEIKDLPWQPGPAAGGGVPEPQEPYTTWIVAEIKEKPDSPSIFETYLCFPGIEWNWLNNRHDFINWEKVTKWLILK